MPEPLPHWVLKQGFGLALDVQLRGAELALALARHRSVGANASGRGQAWQRLLALDDQHRLWALGSAAAAPVAGRAPAVQLQLSAGAEVSAGLHEAQWHVQLAGTQAGMAALQHVDEGADAEPPTEADRGAGTLLVGGGPSEALARGPAHTGHWHLPHAVDAAFLAPPEHAGAGPGQGILVLVGAAPAEAAQALLGQMARAGIGPIGVLDIYNTLEHLSTGVDVPGLPGGAARLGPADAARRASFCRRFAQVLQVGPACPEAPAAMEARALGLALVCWRDGRAQPHDGAARTPDVVAMDALARALVAHLEVPAPLRSEPLVHADSRRVWIVNDPAELGAEGGSPRGLALVGPAPAPDTWPTLADQVAQLGCSWVAIELGEHAQMLAPMMMAHLRAGRPPPAAWPAYDSEEAVLQAAAAWLPQQPAGAALTILMAGAHGRALTRCRDRVAQMWAAGAGPGPVVAINSVGDAPRLGASDARVGAAVASADIVGGAMRGLRGRARCKWLRTSGGALHEAPVFMHPHTLPARRGPPVHEAQLWSAATLREALQQDAVDVIFMGRGPHGAAMQALRSRYARRPVPLVHVLHGLHKVGFLNNFLFHALAGPVYPFDAFISPSACGRTAFLHAWREVQAHLQARGMQGVQGEPQVPIIPYGVDVGFFAGLERAACKLALGLPTDVPVVLSLCRITRRFKACLLPLLIAFAQARRRGTQAHLVIAGQPQGPDEIGRLMKAAQALGIAEHLSIRAELSVDDKAQLLAAADIYVGLSDNAQETHGIALIEAMAAGTSTIAAAWNGFREVVEDGVTGILVPTLWGPIDEARFAENDVDKAYTDVGFNDLHETVSSDVGALAAAIERQVSDPNLRARMGAAGARRAKRCFDSVRQGRAVAEHLLAAAAEARRHPLLPRGAVPPLLDRPDVRFAHYASTLVGPETQVAAGPMAHDPAFRAMVLAYMGDPDPALAAAMAEGVAGAQQPVPLGALAGPNMDLPRLLRCVKYDLLRLV